MMGKQHLLAGALAGALATSTGADSRTLIVFGAAIGAASSHGALSPDVDQTGLVRSLPNIAGLLTHRYGLSHWWGLPLLAWWGISNTPVQAHWVAYALLAGWVSHLLGDFIFGKLALLPFEGSPKFGLGLKTDGFLEKGPARAALILALGWVLWFTPGAPAFDVPDLPASMPFTAAAPAAGGDYDRKAFGTPWADTDRNGCSTRDDVLARDLTDETSGTSASSSPGCSSGTSTPGSGSSSPRPRRPPSRSTTWCPSLTRGGPAPTSGPPSSGSRSRTTRTTSSPSTAPPTAPSPTRAPTRGSPPTRTPRAGTSTATSHVKAKYQLTITPTQAAAIAHTVDACENGEAP